MSAPIFKYESSRRLYELRLAAYPVAFSSADSVRCSDVLNAISKDGMRPKEQRSSDPRQDVYLLREWNRVMRIASSNAPANVQPVD